MNSALLVCVFSVGAQAFPKTQTDCGADERGVLRLPGDSWQEDCNRCRCLASGRSGCTRQICGDFHSLAEPVEFKRESHSFVESGCGADERGVVRQPGDSWQEECNRCHCLASGRSGCTKQICGDLPSLVEPVDSKRGNPTSEISGCGADKRGVMRQPGDSWQEECNRCRCLASGRPGCTRKFCGDFPSLVEPVESKRANHSSQKSGCGADERGVLRQPGDSWQEECNSCRCLASGRPGCTRQFCGDLPSLAVPVQSRRRNPSSGVTEI